MDADREDQRLEALYRYYVLDTPPEESFDRITRLTKALMDTPIALVSLIDRDRQWFKSRQGLDLAETPRNISFCARAIEGVGPMIIPDVRKDARFRDNPLVVGDPRIRFYMGIPLRTTDGQSIGTLCAIDRKPRQPTQGQIATMRDLASLVMDELELHRLSASDNLTAVLTHRAFMGEAERVFRLARRYRRPFSCIVLDVDQLRIINERGGQVAGDMVLRVVASTCALALRSVDILGRVGGDEFAIALPETELGPARLVAERLREQITEAAKKAGLGNLPLVTTSLGVVSQDSLNPDMASLMLRAETAMERAKRNGCNQVVAAGPGFN